jgi:hypothetical protein
MDFGFDVISAEEYERQRVLYEPLTDAIRRLIGAGIHTDVGEATAREAQAAIEAVTAMLESKQRTVTTTLRHEATGRPLTWATPLWGYAMRSRRPWSSTTRPTAEPGASSR